FASGLGIPKHSALGIWDWKFCFCELGLEIFGSGNSESEKKRKFAPRLGKLKYSALKMETEIFSLFLKILVFGNQKRKFCNLAGLDIRIE
ncbi:hypothetical protein C1645_812459, partial [Glomus cerebriforme]